MNLINKLYRYLPLLLIVSILLVNLSLYFTHNLVDGLYISDMLYLPALYKDVISNGGSFSDWFLTPAPYYFPDMPLYFLSNLLTGNYYYAIALLFTIHSLLLIYIVYKIYNLFFDRITSFSLSAVAFAFMHLLPTIVSNYMFVGTIHYGEFLSGLFVVYLSLLLLNPKKPKLRATLAYLFLLLLLVTFTAASDASFSLHFTMPIVLSMFILWAIKRIELKAMLGILIVFATATWLSKIIHHSFSIDKKLLTGNNIDVLVDVFSIAYKDYTAGFIIGTAVISIAFFSLLFKKRLSFFYKNYDTSTQLIFISLFLQLMITGIIIVLSLAPIAINTRYMIPLFEIPVLFAPLYFGFLKLLNSNNITKIILVTIMSTMLIYTFINGRKKLQHSTIHNDYYPPLTQCVDSFLEETDAKYGIATYWNTKPIYLSSKHDPIIAQVHRDLSPDIVVSTSAWRQKVYDFAIIYKKDIDREKIIRINGNPDKIFTCENSEILYYKNKMHTDIVLAPKSK